MADIMEGIRILDFSQEIQGPWGTAILADMGAEVIKVERRLTGEMTRHARADGGVSAYFTVHNRGKKSVTLDLKKPEAVKIVHQIAATSDVIVNNWRIGVLDRLGFGYDQLRELKPDIIFLSSTTFGPKGPWAHKPGRDTLGQAAGGLMHVTGTEEDYPLPAGALVGDHASGIVVALAILAALRYRDQTGEGQRVDTSLYGTVMAMQAWEISQRAIVGTEIGRAGRNHSFALKGAWGAFRTADGYICMAGVMPDAWTEFCEALDEPRLLADPRFAEPEARGLHLDELQDELDAVFVTRTSEEWLERLEAAEQLVAPIQTYDEIIESEQAIVNGYIQTIDDPTHGPLRVVGAPVGMSEARIEPRGPAPELGQQTEELLLELGYSWEEIAKLRDDEVI